MSALPSAWVNCDEPGAAVTNWFSAPWKFMSMLGMSRVAMSISSCAPPGRNCAILSTGTGIATPPGWTPGAGEGDGEAKGFGFGVGVRNKLGTTGVVPGVGNAVGFGVRLCAK